MSDEKRRHPHVVNLSEVPAQTKSKGQRFGCTVKWLGDATGARGVGCAWYEIPPGRAAFPAHYHCANEEAIFVLEGEGTLRIGDETVPVGAGDYVTFPVGPEFAHRLTNTGQAPLRYLCLSTLLLTDVIGYPDSGKVGMYACASHDPGDKLWFHGRFRLDSTVDYYDGEEVE